MRLKAFGCFVSALLTVAIGAAASEPPLVQAVKSADLPALRALLNQSIDVNAAEADGTTALHWAVHRSDLAAADMLLRAGAKVNAANRYGVVPLTLACENGHAGVIERLLQAGADVNAPGPDGETPLMVAARAGTADAVKVLLARGADVNAVERWRGQTALMWAAAEYNTAVTRVLLEAGANVRARSAAGFTPLLFATRGGHIEASEALIRAGADVNEQLPDGTSPLVVAVTNAHYELAAKLAALGADPNSASQGWTALHQIIWTRRPNRGFANPGPPPTGTMDALTLVRELVARGANLNARETKEPKDGYRNLLNRSGATPFLLAAKSADLELMRALLANGADPTITTDDHTTALMAAAGVGIWAVGESPGTNDEALEAVKLLVDRGAEVNAVNDYGYTALHGAAHRGANGIVQFLVSRGARLDVRLTKAGGGGVGWQKGWTPLMIAEGLFYANSFKRFPETAVLIRKLMAERGLSTVSP